MEDIITAAATAWGEGGIAIVRLSGEGSAALVDKIFRAKRPFSEQQPRLMVLGTLQTEEGVPVDEVLAVRFEKGSSYTGEESAEIHCHGGILAAQRCIEALCRLGARIAQPGEFTRRAFVSGRIDLAQAEAVIGIIKARSDEALTASTRSLQGGFTREIKALAGRLTELAASLEVDLDFPEEGEGFIGKEDTKSRLKEITAECYDLLSRCRTGMMLRDGVRAAIIGAPNVGKSSLLNALLKEDRAIVTATPGTTRDSIEETFVCRGLPIRIIDTAGIRDTSDEVEAIGVERALGSIEKADLIIRVLDASEERLNDDLPIDTYGKKEIVVLNKCDLPQKICCEDARAIFSDRRIVTLSALNGEGVEELKEVIVETALSGNVISGSYGVTSRQTECLAKTKDALEAASLALTSDIGDDLVLSCLSEARSLLSSLLGLDASEELLDRIFSDFCVGK